MSSRSQKKKNRSIDQAYVFDTSSYNSTDPNKADPSKLVALDNARGQAYKEAGLEAPVYGLFGRFYKWKEKHFPPHQKHAVNKKTYLWLLALTGWMGGHRYYEKRYGLAALYTLFFWTGIPLTMCVIDAMAAIPIKSNEKKQIVL